jgi:hypothetical protein
MAHEIWRDHRPPRPGLDRLLGTAFVHPVDFLQQLWLDEWTFLK